MKGKRPGCHPARELYLSSLFRLASAYLDAHSDDWYVLSAKYGLVHKDTPISAYELTLNGMPMAEVRRWADEVWQDLRKVLGRFDKAVILAGDRYRRYLEPRIAEVGIECDVPLRGLGIGQQLSWLKHSVEG